MNEVGQVVIMNGALIENTCDAQVDISTYSGAVRIKVINKDAKSQVNILIDGGADGSCITVTDKNEVKVRNDGSGVIVITYGDDAADVAK